MPLSYDDLEDGIIETFGDELNSRFTAIKTAVNDLEGSAVALDIPALTAETTAADGDLLPMYDVSASAHRKITLGNVFARFLAAARTFTANVFINGGVLGIGTTSNDAAAALQVDSTTKGVLLPRMTTTQRNAISSPPAGLVIYNTTTAQVERYNGTSWGAVGPVGAGEANTAANVGTGAGVWKDKSGVQLRFKSLTEGTGITLTENTDDIEIEFSGTVGAQNYLDFTTQGSNPSTPGSGVARMFFLDSDGKPYWKDEGAATHRILDVSDITPSPVAVTAASFTFSPDLADGDHFEMVLEDDCLMNAPAGTPVDGKVYVFEFYFDGTYALTLPASFLFADGVTPDLDHTSGKILTIYAMYKDTSFGGSETFGAAKYYCSTPEVRTA